MTKSSPSAQGLWAIVIASLLLIVALLLRTPGLNGPPYYPWPWRDLSWLRALACFAAPLGFFFVLVRRWSQDAAAAPIVIGLVVCSFLFQVAGVFVDPRGLERLDELVRSPAATSYFTDARRVQNVSEWLARFHIADLEFHSSTHPPGPVLFYWVWIALLGRANAALAGAFALSLIAATGVAVCYRFAGIWTTSQRERLGPCFFYALLPALVLFFPEIDQIYPIFAMAMVTSWTHALEGSTKAAGLCGVILFASTLMAYNLLTLGAPFVLYLIWSGQEAGRSRSWWRVAMRASVCVIGVAIAAHLLLFAATGYRAIASLEHAVANQTQYALVWVRPYWTSIAFDLYDFALGGGFVSTASALAFVYRVRSTDAVDRRALSLTFIGLLSVMIVDATGLLRCETARVWMFLQPFVIVPAGLYLASLTVQGRVVLLGLQAVMLIVLRCRMSFLEP